MRKHLIVGLVLAASLVVAVPSASARIVINKSIMGIELGMTQAEVMDEAGEPTKESVEEHVILGSQRVFKYGKTRVAFSGTNKKAQVIQVATKDPDQETGKGVGVGTSKRQIKRKIDKAKCEKFSGFRHCYVGKGSPGTPLTDFILNKDNRVKEIRLNLVID